MRVPPSKRQDIYGSCGSETSLPLEKAIYPEAKLRSASREISERPTAQNRIGRRAADHAVDEHEIPYRPSDQCNEFVGEPSIGIAQDRHMRDALRMFLGSEPVRRKRMC